MSNQSENTETKQKELLREIRRNRIRLFLTRTLLFLGGLLLLGIVVGTVLDLAAFTKLETVNNKIHHFTELLFTSCVGLLCLVLGFERILDFDNIDITLEKQNETLSAQNKHLETSASSMKFISESVTESSSNSSKLIVKIDELILNSKIEPPTVLQDIKWKILIKQAQQIDFLVQGWDGWMTHHYTELKEFFNNGGEFNLFVVNEEGEEAEYIRKLMEKRLEKTGTLVEAEIKNTITNIQDIFSEADIKANGKMLNVFRLNEINWYFAAQFKSKIAGNRDALVLSLYSHHKYPIKLTPAIILYRDSAPNAFNWFDVELEKLKKSTTNNLPQ